MSVTEVKMGLTKYVNGLRLTNYYVLIPLLRRLNSLQNLSPMSNSSKKSGSSRNTSTRSVKILANTVLVSRIP